MQGTKEKIGLIYEKKMVTHLDRRIEGLNLYAECEIGI